LVAGGSAGLREDTKPMRRHVQPGGRRPGTPRAATGRLNPVALLAALVVGGCTAAPGVSPASTDRSSAPTTAVTEPAGLDSPFAYPEAVAAPPLALTDHLGQPFDLALLRGAPVLVYFGYTHCPDVCPATIGVLNDVVAAVESELRIAIVTVDPERDTVPALGEYVRYLTPEYLALTGTSSEIRVAADGYGVTYQRVDSGSAGGYSMAHTAEVYLIDQAGRLVAHYPFGTPAEPIVRDLVALGAG
jgi:protein SCO1/2